MGLYFSPLACFEAVPCPVSGGVAGPVVEVPVRRRPKDQQGFETGFARDKRRLLWRFRYQGLLLWLVLLHQRFGYSLDPHPPHSDFVYTNQNGLLDPEEDHGDQSDPPDNRDGIL